jgi:hypothetical protein
MLYHHNCTVPSNFVLACAESFVGMSKHIFERKKMVDSKFFIKISPTHQRENANLFFSCICIQLGARATSQNLRILQGTSTQLTSLVGSLIA